MNVRGLRNVNKRRAIFSYLKNQKATNFNLQETFSKQEDEKAWSAEWGGKILFSHGSEHSKGVSILVNPNSTFQLSTVEIDSHGRYIIAKLQIEETIFFLVNIYAPNDHREQEQFIRTFYSQTGCSFDGNLANFRRNLGNLIDSLSEASCNPREQVATVFKFYLMCKLRILWVLWLTYIVIIPLQLRKGNK